MTVCMMSQCKNVTVQKVDDSERIDINKKSLSKECELCNYWFFKDGFLMVFGANKTPIEIIREGAFGGTYFRDIFSGKNLLKEFDQLKNIDEKYYC